MLRILFCALFFMSSCAQFSTPIYNDPLYRAQQNKRSELGKGGEPYVQRAQTLNEESSSFSEQKERILNTLAAQKYQLKELEQSIEEKGKIVVELEQQLPELEKDHALMRIELIRNTSSQALPGENKETTFKRYVVEDGDTLQRISQREYGTYTAWLSIYRFNRQQLPNGPNRIYPGQTLFLPVVKESEG